MQCVLMRYCNREHITVLWHFKLCNKFLFFCFLYMYFKFFKQIHLHTYNNSLYRIYSESNDTVIA